MKTRIEFAALLAAVTLPLLAIPAATLAQASQDWNQVYVDTGKGHRVGDIAAPVQLIEYVSYTCPHCFEYSQQSEGELRLGYVGEGKVAVEVRHLIRNNFDLVAALITECGPPERFFDRHRTMMLAQPTWAPKISNATQGQAARWQTGTWGQRFQAIARDLDFYELMEPQGLDVVQIDRCLADTPRAQAIYRGSADNAAEFGVNGTPSFVINGTLQQNVHTWPTLRPLLGTLAP